MEVYEILITPAMAQQMWNTSKGNPRFVSKAKMVNAEKVHGYADVMRKGDWHNDGNPIRFGESGELIDGHHRIAAIIEAGVPISAIIVRGISEQGQKAIDSGNTRAEYARMGVGSASVCSASYKVG